MVVVRRANRLDRAPQLAATLIACVTVVERMCPAAPIIRTMSSIGVCVQPVSATPLIVYRLGFRSPRSFADVG